MTRTSSKAKRKLNPKRKGDNMPGYHTASGKMKGNKGHTATMKMKKMSKKKMRKLRKKKAMAKPRMSQKSYAGNPTT